MDSSFFLGTPVSRESQVKVTFKLLFATHNSYLCDELSKLIFTDALALVGRVTKERVSISQ
jgi:hypothetical protein